MITITEKAFQKNVCARFRKIGAFVAKMEAVGQRGFPDLLVIYKGRSLYLELKSPKGTGRLSDLQILMHESLREAGAWVEVAQNMSTIDDIIGLLLGCSDSP